MRVRCLYNERDPCDPYLWLYVCFHIEEVLFVPYVFLAIKQCACLCFHALQARVLRWIKPATTSLLRGPRELFRLFTEAQIRGALEKASAFA